VLNHCDQIAPGLGIGCVMHFYRHGHWKILRHSAASSRGLSDRTSTKVISHGQHRLQ
jgi:hypothetical protein